MNAEAHSLCAQAASAPIPPTVRDSDPRSNPPSSTPSIEVGILATLRDGVRSIRPSHVATALTLALIWGLAITLGTWLSAGTQDLPTTIAHFVYYAALTMLVLVVAVAIAQEAAGDDPARIVPYAIAVIAAAVLGRLLFVITAPHLGIANCACGMDKASEAVRSANMLPDSVLICAFVTAGFRYRARAAQRLAHIRAAALDHAQMTRRVMESNLQAMQACIEPQVLLDTLHDVDRLHRADPEPAGQLVDELIAYLRAALPQLRDSHSSLAREIELVHAWLNIRRLRSGGGPTLAIEIEPGAGASPMPPMLLLPIVDHVLTGPGTLAEATFGISARIHADRLQITVMLRDAGAAAPREAPSGVAERLAILYGSDARLRAEHCADGATRVTLEIPHEATHGNRR